jgi:hypothetical protein
MTNDMLSAVGRRSLASAFKCSESGLVHRSASSADASSPAVATIVAPAGTSLVGSREPHLSLVPDEPLNIDAVAFATMMAAVRGLQAEVLRLQKRVGYLEGAHTV